MTVNEFKIWLEGFSESISVAPTPQQWARIKEKLEEVKEVKGEPVFCPPPYTKPQRPIWPNIEPNDFTF
jgi:hypothetical protein